MWQSIRLHTTGLVVPFPRHWLVAELNGDTELMLQGYPNNSPHEESKRVTVTVVYEDVVAHPGMSLETYAKISMLTFLANDESLVVVNDISRSKISCCGQETLTFTFTIDVVGDGVVGTNMFWFSVFKLGTCFVMVHCFASKDAFLEHQPVLNQLLLDMEIDDTLLQKFKQPFHGSPTVVFSSNEVDLSFEAPSFWKMKRTETHLAFLSLPIMSPFETDEDVKFMVSVEGPLSVNNTLFTYCEFVQNSFTTLNFCTLYSSEFVSVAGVPAMRSRFINSLDGQEENNLVLDVFAWIVATKDEESDSTQFRGITALFSCPSKYISVYEDVFTEIMKSFKLYSPWKSIVKDLATEVAPDMFETLRSVCLYKFPPEPGSSCGFQVCLPSTWQFCSPEGRNKEFSAHFQVETGDGFGKLKVITGDLSSDPLIILEDYVQLYVDFLKLGVKNPENYSDACAKSVEIDEMGLQSARIAGRDARKFLLKYEMHDPCAPPLQEGEGSTVEDAPAELFRKALVTMVIHRLEVWILEFESDKEADADSFNRALPLLEKFIIPTFRFRNRAIPPSQEARGAAGSTSHIAHPSKQPPNTPIRYELEDVIRVPAGSEPPFLSESSSNPEGVTTSSEGGSGGDVVRVPAPSSVSVFSTRAVFGDAASPSAS